MDDPNPAEMTTGIPPLSRFEYWYRRIWWAHLPGQVVAPVCALAGVRYVPIQTPTILWALGYGLTLGFGITLGRSHTNPVAMPTLLNQIMTSSRISSSLGPQIVPRPRRSPSLFSGSRCRERPAIDQVVGHWPPRPSPVC